MTFQQLYYLLEVEKTGSFSKAAQNLFITQSTISNAVASLEKEVGNPIFIRGKKSLIPTQSGEDIIAHAKRICESHRYITAGDKPQKPTVRIGAIGWEPVKDAFLQLLEENRDRNDIQFALYDGRHRNFTESLLSFQLDLAVAMYFSPYQERTETSFMEKKLCYEKLVRIPASICIGPGHRLYNKETVCMEDLKDDYILEIPGKPVNRAGVVKAYVPMNPKRTILACNSDVRKEILRRGLGYTVTHMRSAQKRAQTDLRYIPIEGLCYVAYAFYDPLHPMLPETARFLEILKENVAAYEI